MTLLSKLRSDGKPALAHALATLERGPDSAGTLALLESVTPFRRIARGLQTH